MTGETPSIQHARVVLNGIGLSVVVCHTSTRYGLIQFKGRGGYTWAHVSAFKESKRILGRRDRCGFVPTFTQKWACSSKHCAQHLHCSRTVGLLQKLGYTFLRK